MALALSRGVFGLVGVAGLAFPAGLFLSAIASGCVVEFGRLHVRSVEPGACVQTLDTPLMIVTSVVGLLFLMAALWVTADDRAERILAAIGITAGALGSVVPVGIAIELIDRFGADAYGTWTYMAIGSSMTLIGGAAGVVLAAAWARAGSRDR